SLRSAPLQAWPLLPRKRGSFRVVLQALSIATQMMAGVAELTEPPFPHSAWRGPFLGQKKAQARVLGALRAGGRTPARGKWVPNLLGMVRSPSLLRGRLGI